MSRERLRELAVQSGPELLLVALFAASLAFSAWLSPYFLRVTTLFDMTSQFMELGLMALAMTLVIIMGQIDLSVASILALVGVVFGLLSENGVSLALAIPAALALAAVLGMINGWLAVAFRLPALVVTLGTMALYRGIGQILLGDRSAYGFPAWFVSIDFRYIPGTPVPLPLVIFAAFAVGFFLLLHRTTFGRLVYAVGNNAEACRFSGIAVDRLQVAVFTLSGLMSGMAGLMMTSRFASARWDMASGLELDVITTVVLGGTSIFGGRGTITGTVLALFVIGTLRYGMGLANVLPQNQSVVIGLLLILAILGPETGRAWQARRRRAAVRKGGELQASKAEVSAR
ncbi:MAG: ABC transporter permease [Firmicutes bacterium]|nr:ABC transporter permease [Bacillota bacterium]